jgi:hypothetical protein
MAIVRQRDRREEGDKQGTYSKESRAKQVPARYECGGAQVTGSHRRNGMLTELELLGEWIPEQMEPGTLFVLENTGTMGEANNPYVAVLACPHCGALGLITKLQYVGMESMICGSDYCSSEYYLNDEGIDYRKPQ